MNTVPELSLAEAWTMLSENPDSVLIDVRTQAEWTFVGVPDVSSVGKGLRAVEWTSFPTGAANTDFVDQATEGLRQDQPLLLLCRSGARSESAARALIQAGFENAYNVVAGFEGHLDIDSHRHGGWKEELPWRQG